MEGIQDILKRSFAQSIQNSRNSPKYCEKCGQALIKTIDYKGLKFTVPVICKCQKEKMQLERLEAEKCPRMQRFKELQKLSLIGKRYENVTFENSETGLNKSFDVAFKRCQKYCENYKTVLQNGHGIYLFGDKGTGKTHLTACMANELLKKCIPVLLTNLFEISKSIKSTFSKSSTSTEKAVFERLKGVDFLFFDDIGTEIFTKNSDDTWMQTVLFDIINERYNQGKPTIFSSNYSLNELVNLRGISEKTVDRISGMTSGAVIKIEGKSRRNTSKVDDLPF